MGWLAGWLAGWLHANRQSREGRPFCTPVSAAADCQLPTPIVSCMHPTNVPPLLLASAAARLCNCRCPHPALLVLCLLCVQDKKSTLLEASLMEKDAQLEAVQSQLQASPAARSACPGCKPTALHLLRLLGCAPLGWAATSWMPASPK